MEINFKNYWNDLTAEEKRDLAENAGTTYQYLWQLANGLKSAGIAIIVRLERVTEGEITWRDLRPDLDQ